MTMTKVQAIKQSSSNAGTTRGKGTYASKACNVCRRKKVKCDGLRPVCRTCEASGRYGECAWTGESARKPRTEAHFEAMRKRADVLERYIHTLESMLEKCHREHGGTFHDGQSYLQLRSKDYIEESMISGEFDHDSDAGFSSDGADMTAEICVAAQSLKLDERDLVFYGNAAPFRFARAPSVVRKHVSIIPDLSARYTLMIEGVDDSHYNPDFDWSRYLPPQVPLDRKEHDRVLDLLFKFFTSWCMRIVPVLFLQDMYRFLSVPRSQTPPKTTHYSPMLHNALLAVAAGFSDNPSIRTHEARTYFANEAKRLMESECQKPNVSVVHALSMLGSFHSSSGDQGLGYVYIGISARVSQALGLSVDCSKWVEKGLITTHDMYDRNWAYWTTFTQEICWSIYVGRDPSLSTPSEGHTIPIPYIDTEYDQIPWFHPSANIPPQPNYLSRTFAATCELLIIARRVMSLVNSLHVSGNRPEVKDELINSIDIQLHEWKERLSPEVNITLANKSTSTPHKLMLHLSFWWTFILLHRPFFHRKKRATQDTIDHVKLCKRAAENIMDLLQTYASLYSVRYVPVTPIQIAFAAGTVFVLLAVQATTGLRVAKRELEHYAAQADLCIKYLSEMGRSWKCSSDIADILKGLMATQLRPVLERRAIKDTGVRKHVQASISSVSGDGTIGVDGGTASSSSGYRTSRLSLDELAPQDSNSLGFGSLLSSSTTSSSSDGSIFPNDSSSVQQHHATSPSSLDSDSTSPSSSSSFSIDSCPSGSSINGPDHAMQTDLDLSNYSSSMPIPANESFSYPFTSDTLDSAGSMISSMETSGFLAMVGGESISHSPCIPPFSSMEYTDFANDPISHLGYFFEPVSGAAASTMTMRDVMPRSEDGMMDNAHALGGMQDSEYAALWRFLNRNDE